MTEGVRKLEGEERLLVAVERLDGTVNRFCVLLERILGANEQAAAQSRRFLESLHPDAKRIQAEVQRKLQAARARR